MSMYDDQETYFDGLTGFVQDVDAGRFSMRGCFVRRVLNTR